MQRAPDPGVGEVHFVGEFRTIIHEEMAVDLERLGIERLVEPGAAEIEVAGDFGGAEVGPAGERSGMKCEGGIDLHPGSGERPQQRRSIERGDLFQVRIVEIDRAIESAGFQVDLAWYLRILEVDVRRDMRAA